MFFFFFFCYLLGKVFSVIQWGKLLCNSLGKGVFVIHSRESGSVIYWVKWFSNSLGKVVLSVTG